VFTGLLWMEEKQMVKLFFVIGVFALLLNTYSISVIDGVQAKMFTDFVVPMMCMEENGTYYLSMPTNSEFCDDIFDNSVDSEEMIRLCLDIYADEEDKYESCMKMVGFYETRVEDCMSYTFSLGKNKTTSVLPTQVEMCCSVLVDESREQESPTGLLIQELFRGIKDRKIIG